MNTDNNNFWDEEWRDIHFDELCPNERYQVSNYGRVRHWKVKKDLWKLLKNGNTKKDGSGYEYFTNFISSLEVGTPPKRKKISKLVHRLVAEYFCVQEKPEDTFVIHINHNKANNYYKNLQWVNREQQIVHNTFSPRVIEAYKNQKGKIKNSKLTEIDVIRLRRKVLRGNTPLYKIAREFGITHTQLNRIKKGENWAHVKDENWTHLKDEDAPVDEKHN